MRKTEVLLPRASIHPRSRHMIHDSKARRQPSLSKPPPYPSSTLPPGYIQSESRGPILRLLWPLPGGDSELLSPPCSPFLKEAISNLHRAATLMWQPCNILCIFKENMKMWHLSASSSSRDSLSCGVSTGICHCTNMTAQLIVSSGWAARAPHLSPVAAGGVWVLCVLLEQSSWNVPVSASSLHVGRSRKVRFLPESV